MSSELTRYSVVTPKRPDATCLILERIELPLGSGTKRSGSSPPSPVLERPPMRFMAMARLVCASREIEPKLIAPVEKRLTISDAGFDLSSGTLWPSGLELHQPAQGQQALILIVDLLREELVFGRIVAAHRMLEPRHAFRRPGMVFAAQAEGIIAAHIQRIAIDRIVAIGVAMPRARIPRRFPSGRCLRWWRRCR